MTFNARSICNKLFELHQLLSSNLAIICITETWLTSSINDSLLIDQYNYSVYRKDRSNRHGGGVCILINNAIFHSCIAHLPSAYSHLELIAVNILNLPFKCRLIVVYRPPTSDANITGCLYCQDLSDCIEKLHCNDSVTIICGDFNLPLHNVHTCKEFTCSSILSELFNKYSFTQYVREPTRYSNSQNASILDYVLCNDYNLIVNTTVSFPFSTSDHCIIQFDILRGHGGRDAQRSEHRPTHDFKRADWAGIYLYLQHIDFFNYFTYCNSIADCFDYFYGVINDCIAVNVPLVKPSVRSKRARYPAVVRQHLTRKKSAWRAYKRVRTSAAMLRYKRAASIYRTSVHDYIVECEKRIINSNNISAFYRQCNRKFSCRSVIGPLCSPDGNIVCDPHAKAEIFQQSFLSNYTKDNNNAPNTSSTPTTTSLLSNIHFSPSLVSNAIKRLRSKSKGGPDNIPPLFLKKCMLWLAPTLAYLYQHSFNEGYIPPIWATAYVTPVYKKGDRTDPANYRPISLTCVLCKVMESVIKDQLTSYLHENGIISEHQHAFIKQHSTATNLLECTRDWSIALHSKQLVDVVYIDFRRAFDSIVHSKLLLKLSSHGITGNLLNWISVFLSNRVQQVVVDNCCSSIISVSSGVIQGSVLGPILFILFINDLSVLVDLSVKLELFADDLKLFSRLFLENVSVSSSNTDLQLVIDNVFLWSIIWQLPINIDKCAYIRLSSRLTVNPIYTINSIPLSQLFSTRDLGIEIDNRLSFNTHITSITTKATQRVGLLFRGFLCRDLNFMKKAFVTYIRPIIEYNSVIWNPTLKKHIDLLENVQRRFTKRIPSISHLSYLERLAAINLQPLELRRLHFDIVYYYKILHNLTPHKSSDFFMFHNPPATSRYSKPILINPTSGNKILFSSFCCRAINSYNHIPIHVQNSSNISQFKRSLHNLDFSSFLYGSCFTDLADFTCYSVS